MANAIVGTLILIGIASPIGLPVGIGAGLYLAEQRRDEAREPRALSRPTC